MVRKKTGKQRLDKYYHLAKEHGYRARSAFKLTQLNTKFNILQNCTSLIDLCAAPGGWLQVASQLMPVSSTIVGVDLSPIKALPSVTTLQSDITTQTCLNELRRHVSQADVVLHDGAPNVGTDWIQDAYAQNELVIHALKVACEFLKKNGTFLTKVFRSKDYSSILYVLQSLFESVEATKPISSREESAEIFVCCRGYLKPDVLDESFFDPAFVFKEIKKEKSVREIMKDDKKQGYDSFDFYKKLNFEEFVTSDELLKKLVTFSTVEINKKYEKYFDKEILIMVNDLKVVGLNDLKKIVKKRDKFVKLIENDEELKHLRILLKKNEIKEIEMEENDEDWKLNKIREDLKREKRKIKKKEIVDKLNKARNKIYDLPDDEFFEDKLFENNYSEEKEESNTKENKEEIFDKFSESDSESFEFGKNEIEALVKMKNDEENFIFNTVDRNCHGDQENLPDWYIKEEQDMNARIFEDEEEIVDKKTRRKEIEAENRRRKKAKRKVEKILANENDDENDNGEESVGKKLMKNAYKKTKMKPLLVFPKKGKILIPKTKRKIKLVDRRMKKDLRGLKKSEKRRR
ncbi:AdoMet-dependent rRNA methyltransferase spb1 [Conglomerata obtusa]